MSNLSANIMARPSYIWWDDDEVYIALDQHTWLDFYSASSLKQLSTEKVDMSLHWHKYPTFEPTSLCSDALTIEWHSDCCLLPSEQSFS